MITVNCFPSFSEESKPDSESKEVNKGSEVKENLTCACRQEIDRLLERIKGLCFQTLTSDRYCDWLARLQYFCCNAQFSETAEIT